MNIVASRAAIASDTAQWRSAAARTRAAARLVADTRIPPHQFQGLFLPPAVQYGHLQEWFAGLLEQAAVQGAGIEDVDADVLAELQRLWVGRGHG